jgi:hypothetical protein
VTGPLSELPPKASETIQVGKDWLLARLRRGDKCPLCGQRAQLYRRKINSGMAHSLIRMYRINGTGWVHVPTSIGARSREEGKLAYWKLVEEQAGKGLHGGRAGYWRVTALGEEFIRQQAQIPTYALVYDGRVLGFEGDMIGIKDCLGTKFDYDDLMAGI